jgi:hypothetical protein
MTEPAKVARVVDSVFYSDPHTSHAVKIGETAIFFGCKDLCEHLSASINAALSKSFVPEESQDRLREAVENYKREWETLVPDLVMRRRRRHELFEALRPPAAEGREKI